MTQTIKVIDSLPGTGKTTAIFKHMESDQRLPWLYLSPLKEEAEDRVLKECESLDIVFHTTKNQTGNLSTYLLGLLQEGKNVSCTHKLTEFFTKEHIKQIRDMRYRVVCDEELSLIDAFTISPADIKFLTDENLISKDTENFGRITFLRPDMADSARYGDVKRLAERGCLYGDKNSDTMLVTYLSPDIVLAAEDFYLLTYNFTGGVMEAFLKLFSIQVSKFELPLLKTSKEVKERLSSLIEIYETPKVKEFLEAQNRNSLSSSWWGMPKRGLLSQASLKKIMSSLRVSSGFKLNEIFYTIPMTSFKKVKSAETPEKNLIGYNCRATNEYSNKKYAIHAYNLFPNLVVKQYLQGYGFTVDDEQYALNNTIQWLFRGCIRKDEPMKVTFLSLRMKEIFTKWLNT